MEYIVVCFEHQLSDILNYSDAVRAMRGLLAESETGEYLHDDMAIDGGDAEAVFRGASAEEIFRTVSPVLKTLPFMNKANVTFVYGELDSGQREHSFEFQI